MPKAGTLPSRIIAVVLLALFLLVAYQTMIEPIVDLYRDNATTLAQKEDSLRRYQRLADERGMLVDRLSSLQRDKRAIAGYITEPSDALAATAIQDHASEVITAVGGDIKSVELLSASSDEQHPEVRRIGLRVRLAISMEGLARAMHALEDADPYLFIGSLQVSASRGSFNASKQKPDRQLDVSLNIFGYAQEPSQALSAIEVLDRGS